MNTIPTLINIHHLWRKKIILMDGRMREQGVISQVFLHPSRGRLLGVELHLEGQATRLLVAIDYLLLNTTRVGNEQMAGLSDAFSFVEKFEDGAITYHEFLETEIITEDGTPCGRIKEIYFEEEGLQTVYQIKAAGWRGLFRPSQFIKGGKSNYYSFRQRRLVLPLETPRFSSLTAVAEYLHLSTTLSFTGEPLQNLRRLK